jgi:hypothetical protein
MKYIISKIASLAASIGVLCLVACSPETYEGLDANGIPQASDIDVTVTVDQTTNQYTLTLNNAEGKYPVWTIHNSATKTTISTRNDYKGIITVAGQYPVEVRVGNRNGISEGSKVVYINIENTLVDFAPYLRKLTGGESKTWKFASDKKAHLACGESGTDGTGWWSAQPNEKAGTGLYDNRFTFSMSTSATGGNYTYDPGTAGTVYVNTGIASLPPYTETNPGDGNDYAAPAKVQNTTFEFKVEGTDLYMEFPAGTLMGYIPNVEAYNNPRFKVNAISNDNVELTLDNGSIAWHYILGTLGEAAFTGFKYDSEFNLWRKANISAPTWYYAPGWSQIADPEYTLEGSTYTVKLPQATSDTWQAQMHIASDISTQAGTNYDFSVVLNSSTDHPHVMVKLVSTTDDGVYYCADAVKLKAFEDYVYYFSDVPGQDIAALKLVLDFGGNAAGTVVTASNIVLKRHADDDGTVLPSAEPEAAVSWVDENSVDNMWHGVTFSTFFYYAPGWSQIADPGFDVDGSKYTITLPSATSDQWQAQVHLNTDLTTSSAENYDFRITLNSTKDIKGATVKLVQDGKDDLYYFAERINLTAYDDITYKCVNMQGIDMTKVKLVLDFGGNPADAVVTASGIILQKHRE